MESGFLESPRETKIGSRNRTGGKITEMFIQGKRLLVREIERLGKSKASNVFAHIVKDNARAILTRKICTGRLL